MCRLHRRCCQLPLFQLMALMASLLAKRSLLQRLQAGSRCQHTCVELALRFRWFQCQGHLAVMSHRSNTCTRSVRHCSSVELFIRTGKNLDRQHLSNVPASRESHNRPDAFVKGCIPSASDVAVALLIAGQAQSHC